MTTEGSAMVDANVWWNRLGAVSGLVAVVVIAVAAGTSGSFDENVEPADSAMTIAEALAHRDIGAGPVIALAGTLIFLLFASYLRRHLTRRQDSWLADVFYGGAMLVVVAIFAFATLDLAMDALDDPRSNPEIAKTLFVMEWNAVWLFAPGVIAAAAAAAAMSIRFGALPRWLGWLAVLVALTGLMPWIGALVFIGWIGIVSVTLVVQQFREA